MMTGFTNSVPVALEIIIFLVILALAFDFMNGFHDAANSIATVVSTGVLRPQTAVAFAAAFNFIAYFLFPLTVAATIGKGIIKPEFIDHYVIFGALCGALTWNIITWWYGIPSSSSHALIGGLVGSGVAKGGFTTLVWSGLSKTILFIILSPALGFIFGSILMLAMAWIFRRKGQHKIDGWFRRLQLVSAAAYSLGHGANDAQKTAGIIWMLLVSAGGIGGATSDHLPGWVVFACYLTIGIGPCLAAGGL